MNIRSVTCFTDLTLTEPELALAQAANFLHTAASTFSEAGYEVQTKRVASQPFPRILAPVGPGMALSYVRTVQELANSYGIDYLSLGPAHADDDPDFVDAIPDIIAASETLFCSISIADPGRGIDLALIRQAADVVRRLSTVTPDGLSNLFLAAIANCPPGMPFFPVAYHDTGQPTHFALALESADLAVAAFKDVGSLSEGQHRLTESIEREADALNVIATGLAVEFNLAFSGLDFSLAPYPNDATSLAGAVEAPGVRIGGAGAAAAASAIMSALDNAPFKKSGFNGLMLPVLEDSVLARRAAESALTVNDLLLYSTICGIGLDTVPLPGDIAAEALAGILLDVGALALRLDKPLTARLMPLPGKAAGDPSGLEAIFSYFAPGGVLAAPAGITAGGLFSGEGSFHIRPRG